MGIFEASGRKILGRGGVETEALSGKIGQNREDGASPSISDHDI